MTSTALRALAFTAATATIVPACRWTESSVGIRPVAAVRQHDHTHATHGRVSFESPNSGSPTVLTANCDPAQPADCLNPLNLPPSAVTGDLSGTSVTSGVTTQRNGIYPSVSLVAFSGRAKNCGTGGLLLVVKAALDPATFTTKGTWSVYRGQGTGGLSRLTGGGSMTGDAAAFHFRGWIRCR